MGRFRVWDSGVLLLRLWWLGVQGFGFERIVVLKASGLGPGPLTVRFGIYEHVRGPMIYDSGLN